MTHIIDTLHQDHEKVSQLIEELKGTGGGAEQTRSAICQEIKHELMAHAEFEEEVFYPALRDGNPDAGEDVDAAFEEHEEVERILDEIEQTGASSEGFLQAVGRLEKAVQEHVLHEESRLFPMAKEMLERQAADQMSSDHDRMVQEHMARVGG